MAETSEQGGRASTAASSFAPEAMTPPRPLWRRLAPMAVVLVAAALLVGLLGDTLAFKSLAQRSEQLIEWRDRSFALSLAVFALLYVLVVAFSLPGALWMTLFGGFLFGPAVATPVIVVSATLGATIIFLIARSSVGLALRERAGPWLARLRAGVERDAVSYLLIMRLAPMTPFWIANLAPAFLGVRASTFVWTTFLGIIPATLVYSSLGAGLGDVIQAGRRPGLELLLAPTTIAPLIGLALLAALPIPLRRLCRKRAGAS